MRRLDVLVVSALARAEVPAALWRKQRSGEIDADDARVLAQAFEADYHGTEHEPARFHAINVTPALLDHAAELVATHSLRAYDSVQLASALAARDADPGCRTFACFDADLRTAAAAHRFELFP